MSALVTAPALSLFTHPDVAHANEYGSTFTKVNSTTWDVTSPSGLKARFATTDIIGSGVTNQVINMTPRDISEGKQAPAVSAGTNGLGIGLTGNTRPVFAYPMEWSGDQKWHPATSTTITFDHPVVSPTVSLSTSLATALHDTDGTVDGAGTAGVQLQFAQASGPSGTVPITVSAKPGFNTGLYDVTGNTITPKPVGGNIPYLSSYAIYCDPSAPMTTAPGMSDWINPVFPDVNYIAGQCGSVQIDTGGQAITQLTLDQNLTFVAAALGQPWNGSSFMGTIVSFSAPTEVSGSLTPTSFGAATHDVSTLAIGTPSDAPAIQPAYAAHNLTSAAAGTATDNSDAGYTTSITHTPITNHSSGTVSVQVPYTGLSQDAYLNGWIDFNENGQWDPGEEATSVVTIPHTSGASQSGTAALTFTVPATAPAATSSMWMRLRLAYDAADVASSTGMARSGEVEDHPLVVLDATPDLHVVKTADVVGGGMASIGSIIQYTVTVTNQSETVDANGVTITDTLPDGVDVDLSHADTSAGLHYDAATRVLTSDPVNIRAGGLATFTYFGTATATGTQRNIVVADTPLGCQTTNPSGDPCSSSSDVDVEPSGSLQLEKTTPGIADDAVFTLGQEVTYRFTVTNASTDPISNIVLTDPKLGGLMCTLPVTSLAPGAWTSCDATYTVTQADIDAGRIVNHATVNGDWPNGPAPEDDSDKTNDTDAESGALVIDKVGTLPDDAVSAKLGDSITYAITATNTSGYTMSDVTITDDNAAGLTCTLGEGGPAVTFPYDGLAPHGVLVCTATHVVTQADVDAGHVANVATGEANLPPNPDDPDAPIPADVTPGQDDTPVGGLDVLKQAFLGSTEITNEKLEVGQVVTYKITTTNTSAYPITDLTIKDSFLDEHGVLLRCDPSLPVTLAHGQSVVCTGRYEVQQADVDRGHILNVATATGQWPDDPDYPGMPVGPAPSGEDSTDTPTQFTPGDLVLAKSAVIHDESTNAVKASAVEGDTIAYTITAHNTSNLTMSNVTLTDAKLPSLGTASSTCSIDSPATADVTLPASLGPDATLTCTGTYTVTAADAAAGKVANVVTGAGEVPGQWDPQNPDVTPPAVPVTPVPATNTEPVGGLVVTKTASAEPTTPALGDTIAYTVTMSNTSAYPMVNVRLVDTLTEAGHLTLTCDNADPISGGVDLAPHATITCTGTYTVVQADVDAGRVLNTATASGTWGPQPADWDGPAFPTGDVPPAGDSVVTPTEQTGGDGLVLTKDAVVNDGARTTARVGDTITFLITGTNTSNQTMHNVIITDAMLDAAGVHLTCVPSLPAADLAPGAVIQCRATYTVTAADVKHGSVANTVTASGVFPPTDDDPNGTPASITPASSLTPTTSGPTPAAAPANHSGRLGMTGVTMGGSLAAAVALIAGGLVLAMRRRRKAGHGRQQ